MNKIHELLNRIQDRAEAETRNVSALYNEVKEHAGKMYLTGTFTEEMVVAICSNLIKMYALRSQSK